MYSMTRNLGQTNLRRKRRSGDPLAAYDGLPTPVRQWVAHAALPWSPASVRHIWSKSRSKGLSDAETLASLAQAEARDRQSTIFKLKSLT